MPVEILKGKGNPEKFLHSILSRAMEIVFEDKADSPAAVDITRKHAVWPVDIPLSVHSSIGKKLPAIIYQAIADTANESTASSPSFERVFRVDCRSVKYDDVVKMDRQVMKLLRDREHGRGRFGGQLGLVDQGYTATSLDGKVEQFVYQRIRSVSIFI